MRCILGLCILSSIALVAVLISQDVRRTVLHRHKFHMLSSLEKWLCSGPQWKPDSAALLVEVFRPLTDARIEGKPCILAFSAYFDRRKRTVEIITDASTACYNLSASLPLCLVWYPRPDRPYLSQLRLGYITTHHAYRKPRVGAVYSCSVDTESIEDPYAVTIVSPKKECQVVANATTLQISYPDSKKHIFAVCTPPLFGKIEPRLFSEFIEIHLILGATKFYMYNASTSAALSKLLGAYVRDDIIQVIQWQSLYPSEVFYNNQGIMQVDCMYRNMNKTTYVAQIDIDEVLMSRQTNWIGLTSKWFRKDTAALMFLNRFYTTNTSVHCPRSNVSISADTRPTYLKRLSYYDQAYKPRERSKVMYSPERVQNIWTHYITPYPGYKSEVMHPNDGVLHHYRLSTSRFNATLTDFRMCGFENLLVQHTNKRLSRLK